MKFEVLLESLELREFRGQYFPYASLKRQLDAIAALHLRRPFVRKHSFGAVVFATSENKNEDPDGRLVWQKQVEAEATRIGERVDEGLRELQQQLVVLTGFVNDIGNLALTSQRDEKMYLEIRSLDALDQLAEGLGRWRNFAELNYATLIRLWQKYDEKMGTTDGVEIHLPCIADRSGLSSTDRFEQLDEDIKACVRSCPSLRGLDAKSPQVARWIAGLGTERNASLSAFERNVFALGAIIGICATMFVMSVVLVTLPSKDPETFSTLYFLAPLGVFRLTLIVPLVYWAIGTAAWICDTWCINHYFILRIDPRCQVRPSFFFKKAAVLTSAWLLVFTTYVLDYKFMLVPFQSAHTTSVTRASRHYVYYPILTLVFTLAVELGPSRICRYKYRYAILQSVGRTIMAPLFFVTFADNMIGDILTSLSRPLTDVAVAFCYLNSHHPQTEDQLTHFSQHRSHCPTWEARYFRPLISGAPLFFRAMQCLRRFRDTRETAHLLNFAKYCSSGLVVVIPRLFDDQAAIITVSVWATLYSTWWDVVKDWGLGPCELYRIWLLEKGQNVPWWAPETPGLRASVMQGRDFARGITSPLPGGRMTPGIMTPGGRLTPGGAGTSTQQLLMTEGISVGERAVQRELSGISLSGPPSQPREHSGLSGFGLNGHSGISIGGTILNDWVRQPSMLSGAHAPFRSQFQKRQFSSNFYLFAIVFDVAGRSTWALNFLPLHIVSKELTTQSGLLFFIIVMEIARRALWAVLRLEWEQVSNASGFRALLWVPARIKNAYREKPTQANQNKAHSPALEPNKLLNSNIEMPCV